MHRPLRRWVFDRCRDERISVFAWDLQLGKNAPSVARDDMENIVVKLEGESNLLQVITARRAVCNLAHLQDSRNQQTNQSHEDPDHDKGFNENQRLFSSRRYRHWSPPYHLGSVVTELEPLATTAFRCI